MFHVSCLLKPILPSLLRYWPQRCDFHFTDLRRKFGRVKRQFFCCDVKLWKHRKVWESNRSLALVDSRPNFVKKHIRRVKLKWIRQFNCSGSKPSRSYTLRIGHVTLNYPVDSIILRRSSFSTIAMKKWIWWMYPYGIGTFLVRSHWFATLLHLF